MADVYQNNEKGYVGDIGTTILIDCSANISAATLIQLKVKTPDNKDLTWVASVDPDNNQYIKYTVREKDFLIPGYYYIQPYIEISGFKGRGETCRIKIHKQFD